VRTALGCALAIVAVAWRADAQTFDRSTQEDRITTAAFLITYGTTFLVHAYEAETTASALKAGARERNPIVAPFNSRSELLALSLARATAINIALHSIARRNKTAAIVIGAALNFTYLSIANHNNQVVIQMDARGPLRR